MTKRKKKSEASFQAGTQFSSEKFNYESHGACAEHGWIIIKVEDLIESILRSEAHLKGKTFIQGCEVDLILVTIYYYFCYLLVYRLITYGKLKPQNNLFLKHSTLKPRWWKYPIFLPRDSQHLKYFTHLFFRN